MKVSATQRVTTVHVEMTVPEATALAHWLDSDRNSPERSELYQALHVSLSQLRRQEPVVLVDTLPPLEAISPQLVVGSTFAERLSAAAIVLEEIEDDAVDFPAVWNKVQEALGPLNGALLAARQYDDGTLQGP